MKTKLMFFWVVSHYGCLREVSNNRYNQQQFTHVTNFMKYIVHGWDTQCRELSMRLRSPCNLSFFINELQYFSWGEVSPFGVLPHEMLVLKWCYE